MPYIKQEMRDVFKNSLLDLYVATTKALRTTYQDVPAFLASIYYRLCVGFIGKEVRYAKINDVIGAIECCKMEACRRFLNDTEFFGSSEIDFSTVRLEDDLIKAIDKLITDAQSINDFASNKSGILNYLMTRIILSSPVFITAGCFSHILDSVKKEIYTKIASPYEDEKIKENGDVRNVE